MIIVGLTPDEIAKLKKEYERESFPGLKVVSSIPATKMILKLTYDS